MTSRRSVSRCLAFGWASALALTVPVTAAALDPLPEGDEGIAANYPLDEGIDGDAAVIFADDFEDYSSPDELQGVYDAVFQVENVRFATDDESVWGGTQALEFTGPQSDAEISNSVAKVVSPTQDVLFLRYYSKFEAPFDVVGSSHNGSSMSAGYFVDGQATPGVPANGTNKYLIAYENWRGEAAKTPPGLLNIYIYHPLQRSNYGDHFFPSGLVMPNTSIPFDFGPDFEARPEVIQDLDRWYCYEVMLQANTPGELDGRIAMWLDGELVGDFPNLRLRDIDTLKIDRFGIGLHIGQNPAGETHKWYDNVVAATAYIGPVSDVGGGDESSSSGDPSGGSDDSGDGSAGSGPGSADGDGDGDGDGDAGDDGSASGPGSGGTAASDSDTDGTAGGSDGDDTGCGCRSDDGDATSGLWLLAFAAVRRRQRSRCSAENGRNEPRRGR